jgi:hypothetical protein
VAGPGRVPGAGLGPHLALPGRHQYLPEPDPRRLPEAPDDRTPFLDGAETVTWLQPYPDALLDALPDTTPGPDARVEQQEAVSLAFIAALTRFESHTLRPFGLPRVLPGDEPR